MLKKTLMIATAAATLAVATLPAQAGNRHDDRVAGAVIGGVLGAVVGNQINPEGGALVGGVLGAVAGVGIADSHGYYVRGPHYGYRPYYAPVRYYSRPYPVRYAPVYYRGYNGHYRNNYR
jgi:hypothetical protein